MLWWVYEQKHKNDYKDQEYLGTWIAHTVPIIFAFCIIYSLNLWGKQQEQQEQQQKSV